MGLVSSIVLEYAPFGGATTLATSMFFPLHFTSYITIPEMCKSSKKWPLTHFNRGLSNHRHLEMYLLLFFEWQLKFLWRPILSLLIRIFSYYLGSWLRVIKIITKTRLTVPKLAPVFKEGCGNFVGVKFEKFNFQTNSSLIR